MTDGREGFVIDTNVWLDFFLDRSSLHEAAGRLIISAQRNEVPLFTPIHAIKDIFFLVGLELKRMERDARGSVRESFASAVNETAWACIRSVRKQSLVVPANEEDMLEATIMRPEHGDFEDNLVVAAALRMRARAVVTSDKGLLGHPAVPTLSIDKALEVIEGA